MPRIARGLAARNIYHVLNRGNDRQEVFHNNEDYITFIKLMKGAKELYQVKIFAYCLMPNHFHIVLMPELSEGLSKCMQWLMTSHVRCYHRIYGTSGHVWQGRFKSFIIQEDTHLLMVLRYVEGNPVRTGLVSSAKEWLWSSHNSRLGSQGQFFRNKGALHFGEMIDETPIEIPKNWDKYVDEPLTDSEMEKLSRSVSRQSPYGNEDWILRICKEFGIESTIRPRGRPRKKQDSEKIILSLFTSEKK